MSSHQSGNLPPLGFVYLWWPALRRRPFPYYILELHVFTLQQRVAIVYINTLIFRDNEPKMKWNLHRIIIPRPLCWNFAYIQYFVRFKLILAISSKSYSSAFLIASEWIEILISRKTYEELSNFKTFWILYKWCCIFHVNVSTITCTFWNPFTAVFISLFLEVTHIEKVFTVQVDFCDKTR